MRYFKNQLGPLPDYFDRYILECPFEELYEALEHSAVLFRDFNWTAAAQQGLAVYAPGKWTIPDILQHLIDAEWIFAYRALRFARQDATVLPGYDEQHFVQQAAAGHRPLMDLVEELLVLRQSTLLLFRSFTPEMLERSGKCWDKQLSVAALGFIIAGHPVHHLRVIEARYLPPA